MIAYLQQPVDGNIGIVAAVFERENAQFDWPLASLQIVESGGSEVGENLADNMQLVEIQYEFITFGNIVTKSIR